MAYVFTLSRYVSSKYTRLLAFTTLCFMYGMLTLKMCDHQSIGVGHKKHRDISNIVTQDNNQSSNANLWETATESFEAQTKLPEETPKQMQQDVFPSDTNHTEFQEKRAETSKQTQQEIFQSDANHTEFQEKGAETSKQTQQEIFQSDANHTELREKGEETSKQTQQEIFVSDANHKEFREKGAETSKQTQQEIFPSDANHTESQQNLTLAKSTLSVPSTSAAKQVQQESSTTPKGGNKLITLFTTFSEASERRTMYTHTVKNWPLLGPAVQPVLFTETMNSPLTLMASEYGWDIIKLTAFNKFGMPYLNAMFLEITCKYNSTFYGYVNGDILFSGDLLKNLEVIEAHYQGSASKKWPGPPFIIGRRVNFDYHLGNDTDPSTGKPLEPLWLPWRVQQVLVKKTLYRDIPGCLDYFITTKNGFPWTEIPNLVIGREYYDQYLHIMAMYFNLTTIDVSNSLKVLHLKGGKNREMTHLERGVEIRFNKSDHNFMFNYYAVKRRGIVKFTQGLISQSRYFTSYPENGIHIRPRPEWQRPTLGDHHLLIF